MKTPKKIYLYPYSTDWIYEVETKPLKGTVEYTCTDAFIERAEKWLKSCLDNGVWIANDVGDREKEAIMEHFKNYMKGE